MVIDRILFLIIQNILRLRLLLLNKFIPYYEKAQEIMYKNYKLI